MKQAMPQRNDSYDVFLSYNNRDHAAVEALARRLKDQGLSVFLDRWYLAAGAPWPERLEAVLNGCRSAAIFLGPNGMGQWQQREKYLALDRQARDPAFPVIPVLLPGADPALGFLSLYTWVDLRGGLDDPGSLALLAKAIRGEPPGSDVRRQTASVLSSICPYRGLRFFREEDAPFFFGRDTLIEQLRSAVDRHALVAVVGASGSGKSSVVRAGLVPALRQRGSRRVWDIATMVPGDRPLQSLAAVMVRLLEPEMTEVDRLKEVGELARSFEAGQVRLRDAVVRALEKQPGTDRLMLVVDQWEELYTLAGDPSSRQKFLDEVLDATASGPLSVTLTLRGDFYDQVLGYRPLSDRIQGAVVNVSRMTGEELAQVIESPAQKVGLRFEPGLVSRVLDEVQGEPGNLPLLEFVLTELWHEREGETLTHAAYGRIGEVQGAIATHAEKVFAELSTSEQDAARRVFLQLVRPAEGGHPSNSESETGPTRRRTLFKELGDESLPVVRKLAGAHLIVTGRNDATGEDFVDLVHEALIKAWDRLRGWVEDDRVFLAWREKLRTLIGISTATGHEKHTLLRGALRREAVDWLQKRRPDLSVSEQRFIDASTRAARSRLFRQSAASAGVVVLAVSAAFLVDPLRERLSGDASPPVEDTSPPVETDSAGPSDEDLDIVPGPAMTEEEAAAAIGRIREIVGVRFLEMSGTPTIAILGPTPTSGTLPGDAMTVLRSGADTTAWPGEREYTSSLVQCVQFVAPRARFVFIPTVSIDIDTELPTVIDSLVASGRKPAILLSAYSFPDENAVARAFRAVSSHGILVVVAAPDPNRPVSEAIRSPQQFITVASVDLEGARSRFSMQGDGFFSSPGENLPVKWKGQTISYGGDGPAAAVAAGVAARILDRHPDLTPARLMEVLRATSQRKAPRGPPIINLEAALARLSRG